MNRRLAAIAELEALIGHQFADRDLLEQALTHASVGNGATHLIHNERLEFLGDRVLNLMAAEALMAARPEAREGDLSRLMNKVITYQACARVARAIGLPDALRIDASATKVGARDNDKVLGDACEALIAALYVDGGWEVARAFFAQFWADELANMDDASAKDSKSLLQEWAMGRALGVPRYNVMDRQGPAHAPRFTIEVAIDGHPSQTAEGRSKIEAQKAAAALMLEYLEGQA